MRWHLHSCRSLHSALNRPPPRRAAKLAPATLVGRQVRVLWPEDAAWYLGTVAEYDKATGEHTVGWRGWAVARRPRPRRACALDHRGRAPPPSTARPAATALPLRPLQIHYADGERERVALALERVRLLVHAGEALAAAPPPVLVTYAVKLQGLAGLPQYHSQRTALQQRARELQALAQTLEPLHAQERRRASQQLLRSMSGAGAGTAGTTPASTAGAGASSGVHQAPGQPPKKGGPAPGEQAQAQQPAEACAQQPGKDEPQNTAATAERQAQETAAAADQQQGTVPPPLPAQGGTSQPQPQAGGAAEGAALRPLRVGEVGWFKVAGFPHWPFMVITREEAMDRGVHGAPQGMKLRTRRASPLPSRARSAPSRTLATHPTCRSLSLHKPGLSGRPVLWDRGSAKHQPWGR